MGWIERARKLEKKRAQMQLHGRGLKSMEDTPYEQSQKKKKKRKGRRRKKAEWQ